MLTANLLPPEEKKLIKLEEYQHMVRFFGTSIAALLMIGVVLLIPSYIFLSIQKGDLEAEIAAEKILAANMKLGQTFSDATQMQALLARVQLFLNRASRSSQLATTFFANAPGVRVQTLSITAGRDLMVGGFAQTRDDLLNFQKQLQGSNTLETLTFPISDIVRSADIQFTMTGKLKARQGLY